MLAVVAGMFAVVAGMLAGVGNAARFVPPHRDDMVLQHRYDRAVAPHEVDEVGADVADVARHLGDAVPAIEFDGHFAPLEPHKLEIQISRQPGQAQMHLIVANVDARRNEAARFSFFARFMIAPAFRTEAGFAAAAGRSVAVRRCADGDLLRAPYDIFLLHGRDRSFPHHLTRRSAFVPRTFTHSTGKDESRKFAAAHHLTSSTVLTPYAPAPGSVTADGSTNSTNTPVMSTVSFAPVPRRSLLTASNMAKPRMGT